jgi:hypothetical protein
MQPFDVRVSTAPFFYKYGSAAYLNRLERILFDHELYFPTPSQLDDPKDGRPKLTEASLDSLIGFLTEGFRERNPNVSAAELAHHARVIDVSTRALSVPVVTTEMSKVLNLETEKNRIYSMSTDPDNSDLWERYAGSHTGYCLEFVNGGLFSTAIEMTYGDEVTMDVTDPEQVRALFFFRKTEEWAIQKEVRLVTFPRGGPAMHEFDPALLRSITLGRRMSDANRETIHGWAARRIPGLVVRACLDPLRA